MKKNILLFIFLFFNLSFGYAQDLSIKEFFKTEKIIGDQSYANAIFQLEIDTTYTFRTYDYQFKSYNYKEIIDTLVLHDFYVLKQDINIAPILYAGDTTSMLLKLAEERSFIPPIDCPRETVRELKKVLPATNEWSIEKYSDILNYKNWKLDTIPVQYIEEERIVIKYICDPRENTTPAIYQNVIAFFPKREFTLLEKKFIKKYCTNIITFKNTFPYTFIQHSKSHLFRDTQLKIKTEARIESVEVYSEEEIIGLLHRLSKKLYALGLYHKTTTAKINKDFKRAIMKYQIQNQFAIGQFDKVSIDSLLE